MCVLISSPRCQIIQESHKVFGKTMKWLKVNLRRFTESIFLNERTGICLEKGGAKGAVLG